MDGSTSNRPDEDVFDLGARKMAAGEMRLNNERAVLTAVATRQGVSGAEIARRTGLGPQTVSRIISDLEERGLVLRGEVRRGHRGQPATPILLNPGGAFSLGCEIGWRHMEIVLRGLAGEILAHHRRDYDFPHASSIFEEIGSLSRLMMGRLNAVEQHRVVGMGLAMPGGIARNIDLVGGGPEDAASWRDLDSVKAMEKATGLPVWLYNDGNAACWAELTALPRPRPNNMCYFLVSTFICAGIIADGRLWEGPSGNSANMGSMIITDSAGQPNFVHLVASLMALETKLRVAGLPVPTGDPQRWDWSALEPVLSEWLNEAGKAIATAIANTGAVTEFPLAVVDGVMPRPIVERLVERVRRHTAQLPTLTFDHVEIRSGIRGVSAPSIGAALLPVYRQLFSRETGDIELSVRA
ncbi:ROK family transcriptional regulator [Devosia sp.]|uniref:ROK family transcriptional regulator n=1 Tax=Devosia sp. TaxID=1871048 RepID=UPI003BACC394